MSAKRILGLLSTFALLVTLAGAQVNSNIGNITLNATLGTALTISITNGPVVNFTLSPNTAVNSGSNTTTVRTDWILKPGNGRTVTLWAYFGSAASALVHQTAGNIADIPSSAVKIQVDGVGAFNPLTNANPFNAAASGLQIGPTVAITGANKNSGQTNVLAYQIDTTIVPALPSDAYVGTLLVQAQSLP